MIHGHSVFQFQFFFFFQSFYPKSLLGATLPLAWGIGEGGIRAIEQIKAFVFFFCRNNQKYTHWLDCFFYLFIITTTRSYNKLFAAYYIISQFSSHSPKAPSPLLNFSFPFFFSFSAPTHCSIFFFFLFFLFSVLGEGGGEGVGSETVEKSK